ncbi:heavy-metal-associated domain-containing protein [Flavobacterium silvisoli]|uniref:Heavy-metal-associated domain-containing protein n=1 Tax=Flavobacterium silvisoli TaxID=2529433 RepID=A0A4Q9Z2I0_9FLAO|nr:heavy metal-associated domain-containing protein [Flavobacterium silvisoli]TBX70320.1 heavy-metal-associated domain-containing protein [Flavobacterium silvisoli]
MKTKIMIAILLVFATATHAQITKAEITATGLTCSMCSNAINKQLKAMPEVESVTTDLNTNTFTVQLKKDNQITPLSLKQRVEKAGFFVGSMIITLKLDNPKWNDKMSLTQKGHTYILVDNATNPVKDQIEAKVMDKGFITAKEYKRMSKSLSKYPTYAAGDEKTFHLKQL